MMIIDSSLFFGPPCTLYAKMARCLAVDTDAQ